MPLTPGSRVGVFQLVELIGRGGMGEVYRATDTSLGRQVAIKVLPEAFAQDAERLARFEREAKTLASLNHPNIAAIHAIEKSGGVTALVMELVEGDDLSQRIARGAIPIDEALPIAKQIAEALEAAHEQGIIHRDLKPANIKVRADGTVKVLDFGLAKAMEPVGAMSPLNSMSPTITTPAMTQAGMILGTAAYMAPEQARGKTVDKRADIWAFGCVLFEMLTGKRAFSGESAAEVLANILKGEPDWATLPHDTALPVRTLLRCCLDKEPRRRIADVSTARFVLQEGIALGAPAIPVPHGTNTSAGSTPERDLRRKLALTGLMAGLVGAVTAASGVWWSIRPAPPPLARFSVELPASAAMSFGDGDRSLALAPDGQTIFFVGDDARQVFARSFGELEPKPLARGENLHGPFVSPDGRWVGYFEQRDLSIHKVPASGGPEVLIARIGGALRGAAWLPNDEIVFASNGAGGLQRVSANGGEVAVLTEADPTRGEVDHLYPSVLPSGKALLFTISAVAGGGGAAQVAVLDLATGATKTVLRGGSNARYLSTGHLVYVVGNSLHAVPFDPVALELRGSPVPLLSDVVTTGAGAGNVDIAANGTLVYAQLRGHSSPLGRTLVWVDRKGGEQALSVPPGRYVQLRLSPDGSRVAFSATDDNQDLWLWDMSSGSLSRLTFDKAQDDFPVWSPDGERVLFRSRRGQGFADIYEQRADGIGGTRPLTTGGAGGSPTSVSMDGMQIVYHMNDGPNGRPDLMLLDPRASARPRTLLQTASEERDGSISPNGRWLAYTSNISGSFEVYARPFPNVDGGQWQVSVAGGQAPLWSHRGDELFYLVPGPSMAIMGVPIDADGGTWRTSTPTKLVECRCVNTGLGRSYDVSLDDQRFLMLKQAGAEQGVVPPGVVVVQHFDEELKRLVPVK